MENKEWQVIKWMHTKDYAILHALPFCTTKEGYWGGTISQHSANFKRCRSCNKTIPEHIYLQWKLIYNGK